MSVSDWSSDVCSSDLPLLMFAVREGVVVMVITQNEMRSTPSHVWSKGGGGWYLQPLSPSLVCAVLSLSLSIVRINT